MRIGSKNLTLLFLLLFFSLGSHSLQGEEKVFYSWQDHVDALSLSGRIIIQTKSFSLLELKVRHPANAKLFIDSLLTPFFLPPLRLELLHSSSSALTQKEEESTLLYKLDPWQNNQELLRADLFCLVGGRKENASQTQQIGSELHYLRLPLQFPNPQVHLAQSALTPPFLLEPLPIKTQNQQMVLSDLETSIQFPSWQNQAEIINAHQVPWTNLALLGTTCILLWAGASAFKQWKEKRIYVNSKEANPAKEALSQLSELGKRNLIEHKQFSAYYTSLIATLRWYLHVRFPDTYEDDSKLPLEVRQLKEDLIAYADPIKFGRQSSTPMDCELAAAYVAQCIHLVEKQKKESSHSTLPNSKLKEKK